MVRVGFVGLGNAGASIAKRVIAAGYPTTLYARRQAALEPFRDLPVTIAPALRDLGAASEIVFICVVDDAQVEDVLSPGNLLAGLGRGSIAVILSTVSPSTCQRMGGLAAEHGVRVVDSTFSGGASAADEGALTLMVGADDESFRRCLPVLKTFGNNIQHLGPLGMGSVAKAVNNFLFSVNAMGARQAIEMGMKAGLSFERLQDFLTTASGRSFAQTAVGGFMRGVGGHGKELLLKDLEIAEGLAKDLGIPFDDFRWLYRHLAS